jgi:hypothetical protein
MWSRQGAGIEGGIEGDKASRADEGVDGDRAVDADEVSATHVAPGERLGA